MFQNWGQFLRTDQTAVNSPKLPKGAEDERWRHMEKSLARDGHVRAICLEKHLSCAWRSTGPIPGGAVQKLKGMSTSLWYPDFKVTKAWRLRGSRMCRTPIRPPFWPANSRVTFTEQLGQKPRQATGQSSGWQGQAGAGVAC